MSRKMCLSFSTSFDPSTDLTYTGSYTIIDDGSGNWRFKALTSGTLTFLKSPGPVDLFMVGAGGGCQNYSYRGGGGGGYTSTHLNLTVTVGVDYPIVIGAGVIAAAGQSTSAFSYSVNGGLPGREATAANWGVGGDGGSGGSAYNSSGPAGSDGGNGQAVWHNSRWEYGGVGQGTTTKEFAESAGDLYSRGAPSPTGGGTYGDGLSGNNSGSGNNAQNSAGYSGIAIIRNHRA
jgi:hypothetical protein